MLRNLLYSIFFHIIFVALIILSTTDFSSEVSQMEITPLTINFMSENDLDALEKNKATKVDDRVKDMSLDEKIDLYDKIKNSKKLKENKENKVIYEKSDKIARKEQTEKILDNNEENEFSYYYTPVYVSEDKVNTEEKKKLVENKLKREELRKKLKDRKMIPDINPDDIQQMQTLDEVIKISQKPLIVKKKQEKKEEIKKDIASNDVPQNTNLVNTTSEIIEESVQKNDNLDDLVNEMNEIPVIDAKYNNLSQNQIFSDEDYQKLKDTENDGEDSKYMLSLREKRNIQRQIKGCYKMAILRSKKDSKAIVGLTVQVSENGNINMENINVNKIVDNFDEMSFNIAVDNAKSALVFCSPLRGLPVAKYRIWKQMTFVFDSNNLE